MYWSLLYAANAGTQVPRNLRIGAGIEIVLAPGTQSAHSGSSTIFAARPARAPRKLRRLNIRHTFHFRHGLQ